MRQLAFVFDPDRCIGCNACRVACQLHKGLPAETSLRLVSSHERGVFPEVSQHNLSIACNHCERPACAAVCPTGALKKREADGVVWLDGTLCNGCERCLGACPYGAPQRAPGGIVKCDFCTEKTRRGEPPVCVETCVGGALGFGWLDELESREHKLDRNVEGLPSPEWTRPSIRFLQRP